MLEIILPAMGEGIIEADITRWLIEEGQAVEVDDIIVEVATDKVDSEIPSPGSGIIHKIMLREGETAKIGQVLALISTSKEARDNLSKDSPENSLELKTEGAEKLSAAKTLKSSEVQKSETSAKTSENLPVEIYPHVAFLSPIIRKLAGKNGLSPAEIQSIRGSGIGGRITKADVEAYLESRIYQKEQEPSSGNKQADSVIASERKDSAQGANEPTPPLLNKEQIYGGGPSTVEEMDRMRKLIADHMIYSKTIAPHVTSFVETDITEMVRWRAGVKELFLEKTGQNLTFTTLILEAVIKALKDHPYMNVSVDGYKIIRKHHINLGMATALPDGNLIVPVIQEADKLNLRGLAGIVNDLADRARNNKLLPAEIQGGTFTVTNMGQFGNIAGTPIINQPQVAILAVGAILKKPAVVETAQGDAIGIRNMLILSLAYDHRVVDGALGGSFLKTIADYLGDFDSERTI